MFIAKLKDGNIIRITKCSDGKRRFINAKNIVRTLDRTEFIIIG